ncbi:MAG: hypothetical protein HY341_00060 [Candidatus Kerfeldbacteria bacterium]|nr:hypothetical protein [Candidatus Kerfeldbacteria bacterium]
MHITHVESQESPQLDAHLARSMRTSLYAFAFISISLLFLTWMYLRGYEGNADVTIPQAAAADVVQR